MKLEDLKVKCVVEGVRTDESVIVENVTWHGKDALTLIFRTTTGVSEVLLYRNDEARLQLVADNDAKQFKADGALYRLVSEAHRINLAHVFDPMLAVHTSVIEPLPHQITAVYESMLPRQPLRFLLADDPGAGKTIMAGLLIKELIARGDLRRCLIVCPGILVEQWQDELIRRFDLKFEIMTNDKLETAHSGNWFLENDLILARLDKLARDENLQSKLSVLDSNFDLVICDEAHKMSATFSGGEVSYTKRYRLGQLLSEITRNFLLMTATPHNGKEEDFQLFLALLDGDRFEGRFREGVHRVDVTDMMRRMVKEKLLKFDGRPLFPERRAYSVPYTLTTKESHLYEAVSAYVREEFNRAEALHNDKRKGSIGFALTLLQRRLASSPEAIYQSLSRRKARLENRLAELEKSRQTSVQHSVEFHLTDALGGLPDFNEPDDLYDAPQDEVELVEGIVLDQATAAGSIAELAKEIDSLRTLEGLASEICRSGTDTKWQELSKLLDEILLNSSQPVKKDQNSVSAHNSNSSILRSETPQKLVIFTEHRDTLSYLADRIKTRLGRTEAVVQIHGGMNREQRRHAQESFLHDTAVQVLLATDAAGEGINLQRAHLMVNYDLPWNPNRLEQRFGRIHRIGQTEVCHLWNLVAEDTREGDVFKRLLQKIEQAKSALGGQVFDVLGKLQFDGKSLRELLIDAIRYGKRADVRARLDKVVNNAVDRDQLEALIEEKALVHEAMDMSSVAKAREDLDRAHARKLQPFYIESFFCEAFSSLGGTFSERERQRYQVRHVPELLRNRDRQIRLGDSILPRYERIVFDKKLITVPDRPPAALVCPGHPLLTVVINLILERHGDLLKQGAVLVDETDYGNKPRVMFALEHSIRDSSTYSDQQDRVISQRLLYIEIAESGRPRYLQHAPYLDYRPLSPDEPSVNETLALPELNWVSHDLEDSVLSEVIEKIVPDHVSEIQSRRQDMVEKTRAAVRERLTKEVAYWYNRAAELSIQENQRDGVTSRLNSSEANRRAENLQNRLDERMSQLNRDKQVAAMPPKLLGGVVVVPIGLINRMTSTKQNKVVDTQQSAARARAIVMDIEKKLGYEPSDREFERLGYDIESRVPKTGKLRFIEVKGRISGADTITVTNNEVLTALNRPDDYILAIVEFLECDQHRVHYVWQPFEERPDWGVISVNYSMDSLIARSQVPS